MISQSVLYLYFGVKEQMLPAGFVHIFPLLSTHAYICFLLSRGNKRYTRLSVHITAWHAPAVQYCGEMFDLMFSYVYWGQTCTYILTSSYCKCYIDGPGTAKSHRDRMKIPACIRKLVHLPGIGKLQGIVDIRYFILFD